MTNVFQFMTNQERKVAQYFQKTGRGLTPLQAEKILGVARLRSVIHKLRTKYGIPVVTCKVNTRGRTRTFKSLNEDGTRLSRFVPSVKTTMYKIDAGSN